MSIGPWQIILIVLLIVLLFGAGKIPRLAGDVAKGIKTFKKGMSEDDKEAENTADSPKEIDVTPTVQAESETKDTTPKS